MAKQLGAKASFALLLFVAACFSDRVSGFKWGPSKQQSEVVDVVLGKDVTLPCDFVLSSTEGQQMATFFMITWTRENPAKSNKWETLAVNSSDYGNKVFESNNRDDQMSLSIVNNALVIRNMKKTDDGLYRCALRAIFFSEPRTLKLNVQYKPEDLQIFRPGDIDFGKPTVLYCGCWANPKATYNFYHGSKLVQSSGPGIYNITNYQPEDSGDYYCVAINIVGSKTSWRYNMEYGAEGHRKHLASGTDNVAGIAVGSFIAGAALIFIVGISIIYYRTRQLKILKDKEPHGDQSPFEMHENPAYSDPQYDVTPSELTAASPTTSYGNPTYEVPKSSQA